MNLSHLYYFKKLAEVKNYTYASEELFISQPTLSLAISKLENELGTPLFLRQKGQVELTAEGQDYYHYVAAALQMLDRGSHLVKDRVGELNKSIKLGVIYSSQSRQWSAAIGHFRQSCGDDVLISLKQTTTPGVLRDLKKGTVDVGFSGIIGPDSDLISIPCWSQSVTLAVNKEHPLANRSSISLKELEGEGIVSYRLDGPLGPELSALIKGYDIDLKSFYTDEISLCSMVAANPNLIAITCHSWLVDSFKDEINTIPIEGAPKRFRQLYMSYRAEEPKTKIVSDFINLIKGYPFEELE
ncbi:MAG: LysR family transcriptional regulator [Raoultibacter sp.]|jgi:DNA-binding transcriptional LysR family regulator